LAPFVRADDRRHIKKVPTLKMSTQLRRVAAGEKGMTLVASFNSASV